MKLVESLNQLPERAQRTLALLIVPALLLLIWAAVIWPAWHAYQAQAQWRLAAQQLLAQRRGLAEIEPAVQAQLDALPNFQSWQRLFHISPEASPALMLQTEINTALNGAQARPQSFAPLEPQRIGPLQKIGLRIVSAMTIDQLKEFLVRIEALTHFVQIEQLQVNAPPMQAQAENPTLYVTMDVVGYAIDAAALERK